MMAIVSDDSLLMLEFLDNVKFDQKIRRFLGHVEENTKVIQSVRDDLDGYFSGRSCSFKTSITLGGTEFQQLTWQALQQIPPSKSIFYKQLARNVGKPAACRAVANANGANPLAIIVPCHRVIASDGGIGGYGGGVDRKRWLLDHEKACFK